MRIVTNTTAALRRLARRGFPELSRPARARVQWFTYYRDHGHNASLTARHFGISRQTFYYWKGRYDPVRLTTLEARSSQPRRRRQRTWTVAQIEAVRDLRACYPTWGKDKLQVLLAREGMHLSVSMVGRILSYLRARRQLPVPIRKISARKRAQPRPYAIRKPKDYLVRAPGDLVEIDTLDVRPVPGVVLKHFSAHDVISRWAVVELHQRATAHTARLALEALVARMPFRVKAIQIDGGSEFRGEFEDACRELGLLLLVLPPRSPKLNGGVERANRTHTEEFYEWSTANPTVHDLGAELRQWEAVFNTIRPHQALRYQTPAEFCTAYQADPAATLAALPQNQRKERVSRR
ncbi:MAG: DDE-type integrase/transposase/recombinase [Acetobacteraceae bacterium]|nr:DDE-type integrase/transposase/recombinase [Acetobacteraceae bacterium]